MKIGDLHLELIYCPDCGIEEWHLLCDDGHLECLGCRAKE